MCGSARRASWAGALVATAILVAGCGGAAQLGNTSSDRNPAPGGVPVTFENGITSTDDCGYPDGWWYSSDDTSVATTTNSNNRGRYRWVHAFPEQPPGTSRDYTVYVRTINDGNCFTSRDTEYRQTIEGPAIEPPAPPSTDPTPPAPSPPEEPPVTTPTQPTPPAPAPPAAPVASFTNTPVNPEVDVRVTFDASGSTSGVPITRYDWSFGPSTFPGTATGQTAQTTFLADGNWPVTLTVTDELGRTATSTRTITVTDPSAGTRSAPRAASAARHAPPPGIFVSTSPGPIHAGDVTRLYVSAQRGVAPGRRWTWGIGGDERGRRVTRRDTLLTVFRHPGVRTVRVRMRDARDGVHTTAARIRVRPARRARTATVRQPFLASLSSRATRRNAVRRYVRRLPKSRRVPARAIRDSGGLMLQAVRRFRPGAEPLMAPLLEARTRGRIDVDPRRRTFSGTYLVTSTAMRAQTCLRVAGSYDRSGARGTITALGGTGAGRRLHLSGTFDAYGRPDLSEASLQGTLELRRGAPRGLPADCRALRVER
jgi:hypothetical protein